MYPDLLGVDRMLDDCLDRARGGCRLLVLAIEAGRVQEAWQRRLRGRYPRLESCLADAREMDVNVASDVTRKDFRMDKRDGHVMGAVLCVKLRASHKSSPLSIKTRHWNSMSLTLIVFILVRRNKIPYLLIKT